MNTRVSVSNCHAPDVDDVLSGNNSGLPKRIIAQQPAYQHEDPSDTSRRLFGGRVIDMATQMCGGLCVSNSHLAHAFGGK
jgi:hypothetical protein